MSRKSSLDNARKVKDDEYYTKYKDVEDELKYYKDYLKDKIIYCPCDDDSSAFVKYLKNNKNEISYKDLVYTSFKNGYDFREQDNSFADVIITNPPFSLFRDFIDWVGDKDCIILGLNSSVIYKNVFPLIKKERLKLGVYFNKTLSFDRPDGSEKEVSVGWYTTFPVRKVEPLELKTKAENEANGVVYKKFDNYDGLNVDKVKDIPSDYEGVMGVPVSFLAKWNKEQFELIDCVGRYSIMHKEETKKAKKYLSMIDGKMKFPRVIIKRK